MRLGCVSAVGVSTAAPRKEAKMLKLITSAAGASCLRGSGGTGRFITAG